MEMPESNIHYTVSVNYEGVKILFTEQYPSHFISVLAKSGRQYASICYKNCQHHGIHVPADY